MLPLAGRDVNKSWSILFEYVKIKYKMDDEECKKVRGEKEEKRWNLYVRINRSSSEYQIPALNPNSLFNPRSGHF